MRNLHRNQLLAIAAHVNAALENLQQLPTGSADDAVHRALARIVPPQAELERSQSQLALQLAEVLLSARAHHTLFEFPPEIILDGILVSRAVLIEARFPNLSSVQGPSKPVELTLTFAWQGEGVPEYAVTTVDFREQATPSFLRVGAVR